MGTAMNANSHERALEELSAFADGELEDGRIREACQQWRADGQWRASWHAYHLIGDVLRSDDLASTPARDAHFLAQLRSRLADEPVMLAPPRAEAGSTAARPQRAWRASSLAAVAAGFVVAGGVLFATRAPDGAAPSLAEASSVAPPRLVAAGAAPSPPSLPSAAAPAPALLAANAEAPAVTSPRASVASGKLIRDVRLDRYLAAHKEFAGSSALGVPSGFLRNATAEASDR